MATSVGAILLLPSIVANAFTYDLPIAVKLALKITPRRLPGELVELAVCALR
jgi:hypothetical protein